MEEIKVTVCKYPDRANLMLRYVDPITGKQKAKSAKTTDETQAIGAAAVWQDELNTGRYQAPSRLTWAEFRKRYEDEMLASLAPRTRTTARDSLNYLERLINPDRVVKLTAATMSRFQADLRKPRKITRDGQTIVKPAMKETTIARHLRHIKAALRWGERQGLIPKAPFIEMPKVTKGQTLMRGRPILEEEFDRMIMAVPKVRQHDAEAWVRYLNGLWLSGLRLEESLALSWDEGAPFYADVTGRRPAFRIYAEAQKARRDEILPMTPDFAQFLLATPETERVGKVFKLTRERGGEPMGPGKVGVAVGLIGKKAGVITNKAEGKFASAHDLRRSFGTRWAQRVMPAVLKRLMRHANIATTMAFYVNLDANDVADQLWAEFGGEPQARQEGNRIGNTDPKAQKTTPSRQNAKRCSKGV